MRKHFTLGIPSPDLVKQIADDHSKHNPFMSFNNIRNNTARCQHIVNAEEHFANDVALGKHAPQYMYYTPNLLNDAHNTNVSYASHDISKVVDTMLDNEDFMKGTLIVVTFDENGESRSSGDIVVFSTSDDGRYLLTAELRHPEPHLHRLAGQ